MPPGAMEGSVDTMTTTADDVIANYLGIEARVDKMRDKYAPKEGYVDGAVSPWVPFIPNVYIQHLTFDIRSSSAANVLWVQAWR